MIRGGRGVAVAMAIAATAAGHSAIAEEPGVAGQAAGVVDAERIGAAEPGSWLAHGRTWDEQRFSPLDSIRLDNVERLGLAWSYSPGTHRGLEATPIVVDGVLYATATWSVAFAVDAATGRELWRYDPQVPRWKGRYACCDVVNRGVAVWKGRVYLGTIDGRLIALDAASGEPDWEVQTVDPAKPYTITGAPRVVKDLVIIGNGGADFGVRGYVSAYDAETGEQRWRFYTVPGGKQGPHEHPELTRAAATWPAEALWESGLGGTVWDSMAYDPELDLLYVGTGNASVYSRKFRSPGGGDNLYLASILALRPETGRLVWHYQTTPGDHWDYTATQHMILADLEIAGRLRKVLLQAPKNGFFYVLDRATGELLSAEKFAHASWATHVDLESGRPVERAEAHWDDKVAVVSPAPPGAHSWHPMSFHPGTGLVYIPALSQAHIFVPDPEFRYRPGYFNTGEGFAELGAMVEGIEALNRSVCSPSSLVAWDPVAQRQVWEVGHESGVPGGVLSTAGGLVFQGSGSGVFAAYRAGTGERVWSSDIGVGIMAGPVSYVAGGEQYVAVLAGIGGTLGGHYTRISDTNEGRLVAYKLDGSAAMPPVSERPERRVDTPKLEASLETVTLGRGLYSQHCMRCHGVGAKSSGLYPDLRYSGRPVHTRWNDIVRGGIRSKDGMASFADVVSSEESLAIQAYIIERATHEPGALESLAEWFSDSPFCVPVSWITD